MRFLIANTFTESLGKLTADEQKAAKTTAFDLADQSLSAGAQASTGLGQLEGPEFLVRARESRCPDNRA